MILYDPYRRNASMALSSQEIRELCTPKEWAIILASQPGTIEKLSAADLKKHAANAQKLVTKWQDLSRSQARVESRKSGSPNLESRSHEKHEAFRNASAAFQKQLASAPAATGSTGKPTAAARSVQARSQRRETRKILSSTKQSINRKAQSAVPRTKSVVASDPAKADPPAKKPAAKKPAAKSATAKLAAQRKKRAAALAAAPKSAPQPKPAKAPKSIAAKGTPAAKTGLAGKVKATRTAIAVRTNKIAGHVSGKGKRAQGKRDSRSR
jgi:hypothetical protein